MASNEVDGELSEPNWDLYQADLKVSKMIIKRPRPRLNFDIPIPPQPPRYRPGNGPRSEAVDLRLVDDSKAFIVDKVILPLEPFTERHDPRQRRAYYIIGWPDLPAARPSVDCARALDYVSPYAIEHWEHEDFLRREAEKEQAEVEAALAAVAQAIAAEKGKGVAGADILPNGKKKPGRKPKNARLQDARPPTPQLDSEQEELLARRKKGPSLSTPQKRKSRIAQLDAEMEVDPLDNMDEDVESDEEIQRQLEGEALHEVAGSPNEEGDGLDLLGVDAAASGFTSSPRASSTKSNHPDEILPHSRDVSLPRVSRSARASPLLPSMQQQRPSVPASSSRLSQIQKPISTSPIPLPQLPGFRPNSGVNSSPAHTSIMPWIGTQTPSGQSRARAAQLVAAAPKADSDVARAPSSFETTQTGNHIGFTPTNSFTPVGSYYPRPPKRPADESPFAGDSNQGTTLSTKIKRERKKKAPKLSQSPSKSAADPSNEPQAEQEYVVKRLEGDSIIDGIQYFKVRWEGTWPPDQNPTWEPRENISAKLVQAYLKRKAEKAKKAPTNGRGFTGSSLSQPKVNHQSTLKEWASKFNYSNVSEAFEGQAELDQMNGKLHDDGGADDDDELRGDGEEFFVVDKQKAEERQKAADERRKSLSSQVAAEFASLGPARASDF